MPLSPENEALVRKHNLHLKFDSQLVAMLVSHQAKLDLLGESGGDLDKYTVDTDGIAAVKWELKHQFPELSVSQLAQEFSDQETFYTDKDVILQEIVDIIAIEQSARAMGIVVRDPIG